MAPRPVFTPPNTLKLLDDARGTVYYLLLKTTLDPFGAQSSLLGRSGSRVEQCAFARVRKHPAKVNKCAAVLQTPRPGLSQTI